MPRNGLQLFSHRDSQRAPVYAFDGSLLQLCCDVWRFEMLRENAICLSNDCRSDREVKWSVPHKNITQDIESVLLARDCQSDVERTNAL